MKKDLCPICNFGTLTEETYGDTIKGVYVEGLENSMCSACGFLQTVGQIKRNQVRVLKARFPLKEGENFKIKGV